MARLFGSHDPIQAGEFEIPQRHGRRRDPRPAAARQAGAAADHGHRRHAVDHRRGEACGEPLSDRRRCRRSPKARCFPTATAIERGETRAAVVERMQAAMTKTLDAAVAEAQHRTARSRRQEQAVILASIVEKETGKAARAADDRRRLLQPPADRHEARCRPDRHLPGDQGQAARPAHPAVGAQRRQRLQHLSPRRPARRADRQSGQGEHRGGAPPGADQGALFRRRRHRRPCVRRHACRAQCQRRQMVRDPPRSGGRCEEPRDRPGRMFIGGLLLFAAVIAWAIGADDEPAWRSGRRGHRACPNARSSSFVRNSAIGTLVLCALSGWLLFPARRPQRAAARLGDPGGARGAGC